MAHSGQQLTARVIVAVDAGWVDRRTVLEQPGEVGDGRLPWPEATFTVGWTIGSPDILAVLAVDTVFLGGSSGSMDRTVANWAGW
jgi:hypothetical protein